MPETCSAYGCSNTSANSALKNISFHCFPFNNEKMLKLWLLQTRRKDFLPSKSSKLCSEHFEETYFTYQKISKKRYLLPEAIPTKFNFDKKIKTRKKIFEPDGPVSEDVTPLKMRLISPCDGENDGKATIPTNQPFKIKLFDWATNAFPVLLSPYPRKETETAALEKKLKSDEYTTDFVMHNIDSSHSPSSPSSSTDSMSDDSEIYAPSENNNTEPVSLSSNLQLELNFLKKSESTSSFKVESITDDYTMYSATGFNVKAFHAVFKLLCLEDLPTKCQLSPLDQFFLMTVYLKSGINQHYLAFMYKIKQCYVSRIISNTAIVVYNKLKKFDIWPSQEAVKKKTPLSFSKKFPNCRIIIDCVEFNIQIPSDPLTQEETLNRKKTYTMKGMIGITPSRTVSFISDLVGGSISDKNLFLSSGLLDLLQPGDLILADEGFGIKSELAERGCELGAPDFCNSKCNSEERDKDEAIFLIEKVIGRIRTYKYFNGQIVNAGLQYSNKYFFIVAFFLNFANPLVPEDD